MPYNEADESGGRVYPAPRFRRRNGTAKNPNCQRFKGGDFFAEYKRKNTTRPLTVWIVGTVGFGKFIKSIDKADFMCYDILGVLSAFGGDVGRGYANLYCGKVILYEKN